MPKDQGHSDKKLILIVEDSADFSNLMKYVIEDMGFAGIQFPVDEEKIVEWAKKHKPAAILMDLALRRKGGMQFIEDLKGDDETKEIPIVIITGRELSQKEVVTLESRGVKYLRKGRVEMDTMKRVIRQAAFQQKAPATDKEN